VQAVSASHPPTTRLERALQRQGHRLIAGVDEVGRGSWAGPIVAAAVILPLERPSALRRLRAVRDSKLLPPPVRSRLFHLIIETGLDIGVGWVSHRQIDRVGVASANNLALLRAVQNLRLRPHAVLVDHFDIDGCALPQSSPSHGDAISLSIAAASIVAKVTRDSWMESCAARFPDYGFERHKGYGTLQHRGMLAQIGPCILHRRCFEPLACFDESAGPTAS
jgi:ribonuclease HII